MEYDKRRLTYEEQVELLISRGLEVDDRTPSEVAYSLGRRGPFAHLSPDTLDADRCAMTNELGEKSFTAWLNSYQNALHRARADDFITHYVQKSA